MTNFDIFCAEYDKHFRLAYKLNPQNYPANMDVESVLLRCHKAIAEGTMSKDGPAFKETCKELGIKSTWKAIDAYLGPKKDRKYATK